MYEQQCEKGGNPNDILGTPHLIHENKKKQAQTYHRTERVVVPVEIFEVPENQCTFADYQQNKRETLPRLDIEEILGYCIEIIDKTVSIRSPVKMYEI
jgi:hypothetical protein